MLILTHCYPEEGKPAAGVWLKRVFHGLPILKIGKWAYTPATVSRLRKEKGLIVACWTLPAGLLARLSGRPYIVYCLGLDCFWTQRSAVVGMLFRPILDKAEKLVFSSRHLHDAMNSRYGKRYLEKSKVIYLPVDSREFSL